MTKMRIAINGFGRIGRQTFKIALEQPEIEVVAINDLGSPDNLAYLLEFDSVYGHYDKPITVADGELLIAGQKIKCLSEPDPVKLPWKELAIDVVIESTGHFTSYEKAKAHLEAGAKRVVLSAPARDEATAIEKAITATPNVNQEALAHSKITTNASCTTNAITPVAAIMLVNPGVKYGMISTVHGYTAEQSLVDGPMPSLHKDFRRGRAAGENIVPTSTGAAVAAAQALPGMENRFDGIALRVPVPAGSILDFTFVSERKTSVKEINDIFREECQQQNWQGIISVTNKPLVSTDIIKNPHGAIVDLSLTRVVAEELVKLMVWYDNEWGYSNMLVKHVLSLKSFL